MSESVDSASFCVLRYRAPTFVALDRVEYVENSRPSSAVAAKSINKIGNTIASSTTADPLSLLIKRNKWRRFWIEALSFIVTSPVNHWKCETRTRRRGNHRTNRTHGPHNFYL